MIAECISAVDKYLFRREELAFMKGLARIEVIIRNLARFTSLDGDMAEYMHAIDYRTKLRYAVLVNLGIHHYLGKGESKIIIPCGYPLDSTMACTLVTVDFDDDTHALCLGINTTHPEHGLFKPTNPRVLRVDYVPDVVRTFEQMGCIIYEHPENYYMSREEYFHKI